MSTEHHKAIVRLWVEEVFNHGDLSVAEELATPNTYQRTAATVANLRRAFPDLHASVDDLIAEGDRVVLSWTVRGTHTGSWEGAPTGAIPSTGRTVTVTGVDVFRMEHGQLDASRLAWDALGLLQQLGVLPTPAHIAG